MIKLLSPVLSDKWVSAIRGQQRSLFLGAVCFHSQKLLFLPDLIAGKSDSPYMVIGAQIPRKDRNLIRINNVAKIKCHSKNISAVAKLKPRVHRNIQSRRLEPWAVRQFRLYTSISMKQIKKTHKSKNIWVEDGGLFITLATALCYVTEWALSGKPSLLYTSLQV